MTDRLLGWAASLSLRRPVAVLLAVGVITVLLLANTRNLQLRTDISDLMGSSSSAGRALREYIQQFGYGNRLFVVVEAGGASELDAERMEEAADRLVHEMSVNERFTSARSQVSEAEMLQLARFYVESFPAFADPNQRSKLAVRLSPSGVREHVHQAAQQLLTSFSTIGPKYFVLDPLGLLEFVDPASRDAGGFSGFDLDWGSGGRFFSRDHRALLIIAEPRQPATDYEFAVSLMAWTRSRIAAILAESASEKGRLEMTPVGAHAYADQNRALIERNIRVASIVSVAGNLLLIFLVYRWLPAVGLTVLPTFLAILWTTGLISSYPGEINLISLAFIAILTGLGDDQVTYFFTRVPQEIATGRPLAEAIRRTYVTTGKSVLFCILASATGTLALAMASFRGLAELGLVLTVGLLMLLVHTLFTIPAVIFLIWPVFPVRTEGGPFRILPRLARGAGAVVARYPGQVLATGVGVLLAACAAMPSMQTADKLESFAKYDDPAFVGQRLLASRFGLEGAPLVLLVEGTEQDVLTGTAALQAELDSLRRSGRLRAVLAPTSLVPSRAQQSLRSHALTGLDWDAAATSLEKAVVDTGLDRSAFEAPVAMLRKWGSGALPVVTVESARRALPPGLMDASIRELGPNRYLGAVTLYSGTPDATASLPAATLARLREKAGPFAAFSYDQVAIDLNTQLFRDTRRASLAATVAVILIVAALFRSIRVGLLVLLPIAYGMTVTAGVLTLAGHRFGAMGFAACPLIVGIGIDNSIHLVRRHLEMPGRDIRQLLGVSGAALIQTNLTTIVGFGALVTATIPPLAELGLITAVGIGLTLLASIFLVPAILVLAGRTPRAAPAGGAGGAAQAAGDDAPTEDD
jgi:predicted RND superfamily exporter protein